MKHFGSSSKMRFSGFLMQNETFWFSYAGCEFWVFLSNLRLFGFLILHETFCPKHPKKKERKKLRLKILLRLNIVWSIFIKFKQIWCILIQFDQVWSSLKKGEDKLRFSHARCDFPDVSCRRRLFSFLIVPNFHI